MNDDPNSLENLLLGAQQNVKNIRKTITDREDFDYYVKRAVKEAMIDKGANPKTIKAVMRAIFEEGAR